MNNYLESFTTLAYNCLEKKEYKEAIILWEKALAKKPDDYSIMLWIACCHETLGDIQNAFTYYEKAYCSDQIPAEKKENIFEKILTLIYIREGACNCCNGGGSCCKNLILTNNDQLIRSQTQLDELILREPTNEQWIKKAERNDGVWLFSCKHVNHNGKCLDYENRAIACRNFPEHISKITAYPDCSYRFILKEPLPIIKSQELLDRLRQEAHI